MPFKATFHGFADVEAYECTPDGTVCRIFVPLEGQGTHLGRFHIDLTHLVDFSTVESTGIASFTGTAVFTAANGDSFTTEFSGQLYLPTDPNNPWATFDVTHCIVEGSGTGRFTNAEGCFVGVNGRYNLSTGEDIGGYEGWISSPGANKK